MQKGIYIFSWDIESRTLNPGSLHVLYQNFSQPAMKEEEEEEEVEIDQRRLHADYDPATFDPSEHSSPPTERVFRARR